MASGAVGRATVEGFIASEPAALVAVVTTDGLSWPGLALPEGCPHYSWEFMASDDGRRALEKIEPDLIFLAWWPFIIKGHLLVGAPVVLNMHPSFLPFCRGKDSNFWAITEGNRFGVTIHHVNSGIDAGDIAFQKEIPLSWEDTGGSLYKKALVEMGALLAENVPAILYGEIPRIPQGPNGSAHFRRELEPASRLRLDDVTTVRDLLNLLRARTFSPHPACRFQDGDSEFEVRIEVKRL